MNGIEEPIAGGVLEAYQAQCNYFGAYYSRDLARMIEGMYERRSFDLDLSRCPMVEDPEVMLPLVGALRHCTYFLSLVLTECSGNQQVLLMLSNVVRFNSTLTKIELANMDSPGSFENFGNSLLANRDHAIQVLDISDSKIPYYGAKAISLALTEFQHSLCVLSLRNCHLSLRSLEELFYCFKNNYGMSLSIQQLDLSQNRLGSRGSALLGNWINHGRDDLSLQHLYLRSCELSYVLIGRGLVFVPRLRSLDVSGNKLSSADVQLMTLWIETSKSLQSLDLSNCGLSSEQVGKILSVMLTNQRLMDVRVHLDNNNLKKESDDHYILEALARGSTIHTLTLSDNRFKASTLTTILDTLHTHKMLHTLVLDRCYKSLGSPQDGNTLVLDALVRLVNSSPNIRALSIAGGFGEIASRFVNQLKRNGSLEELDISDNGLDDVGLASMVGSLRANSSLSFLDIDGNRILYSGFQALLQVFSVNRTLHTVPFPWSDYKKARQKFGDQIAVRLREVLADIQRMCSLNCQEKHPNGTKIAFALDMKGSIRHPFETPTNVGPLAEVPEDMHLDDLPDFDFSDADYSDDDPDSDVAELQDRFMTAPDNHMTKEELSAWLGNGENVDVDVFEAESVVECRTVTLTPSSRKSKTASQNIQISSPSSFTRKPPPPALREFLAEKLKTPSQSFTGPQDIPISSPTPVRTGPPTATKGPPPATTGPPPPIKGHPRTTTGPPPPATTGPPPPAINGATGGPPPPPATRGPPPAMAQSMIQSSPPSTGGPRPPLAGNAPPNRITSPSEVPAAPPMPSQTAKPQVSRPSRPPQRPSSNYDDTDSIGDLLMQAVTSRREFIRRDTEEAPTIEEYSSDDDSW